MLDIISGTLTIRPTIGCVGAESWPTKTWLPRSTGLRAFLEEPRSKLAFKRNGQKGIFWLLPACS